MTTKAMTTDEIKAAGLVIVGEWGYGSRSAGFIASSSDDREAVLVAYEAIEEGDLSSDVLDAVVTAGGQYIEEDIYHSDDLMFSQR